MAEQMTHQSRGTDGHIAMNPQESSTSRLASHAFYMKGLFSSRGIASLAFHSSVGFPCVLSNMSEAILFSTAGHTRG